MAGGKGERLYPLTKERSKPAVPFGGKYRIIDFVLSNFINSGIYSNYVLVQYMSQSLIEYLRSTWNLGGITKEHFITVVPPQMRLGEVWYRGTADAVKQNLNLITDYKPDLVAVFGADHIYRMDIRQMIDFHVASKADVTVSALTVPIKQASRFGTVVLVAVSGRPLVLDGPSLSADALVAAWLPGTEGGGVADILFGDVRPTGRLSFDWPASVGGKPLFPAGFGLAY